VQDVRIRLLRVLRHDCEEADSIEKLEEGGSNISVLLQRMPAVYVLRTVEREKKTHLDIQNGIVLVSALNANIHDAILAEISTLGSKLCGKIIPTEKA
jgi:hypothetical protein